MNSIFSEVSGPESAPLVDDDAPQEEVLVVAEVESEPSLEKAPALDHSDTNSNVMSIEATAPDLSTGKEALSGASAIEVDMMTAADNREPQGVNYVPSLWPGDLQGKMPPPLPFIPQPRVAKATSEIVDWPDTIIDSYVVASVGKAICISLRGDGKRYFGTSRQDSCAVMAVPSGEANSLVHLLAVADGVGSADLSHFASKLACQVAIERLSLPLNPDDSWQTISAGVFQSVAAAIQSYADENEIEIARLLTTLRIAKIIPNASPDGGAHVFVANVGDGLTEHLGLDGLFISNDEADINFGEEKLSPSTKALPPHVDFFNFCEFDLVSGEAVVLLTDGAQSVWNSGLPIGSLVVRMDSTPMEIAWALDVRAQSHMDDRTIAFWRQS